MAPPALPWFDKCGLAANAALVLSLHALDLLRGSKDGRARLVGGEGRRRQTQANTSCSAPARITSVPSMARVVRMTGMSKWPAAQRPANSVAPVENRELAA